MEGVAYQVRENLSLSQQLAGPVEQLIVFGGGARSPLWPAIIGDVSNLPVAWVPDVETAARGAATLAGLGSGVFSSLDEARQAMVKGHEPRWPDTANTRLYDQMYQEYCRLETLLLQSVAACS